MLPVILLDPVKEVLISLFIDTFMRKYKNINETTNNARKANLDVWANKIKDSNFKLMEYE